MEHAKSNKYTGLPYISKGLLKPRQTNNGIDKTTIITDIR